MDEKGFLHVRLGQKLGGDHTPLRPRSTISIRGVIRLGSSMSMYGVSRLGENISVVDWVNVCSSMSLRSFGRVGSGTKAPCLFVQKSIDSHRRETGK